MRTDRLRIEVFLISLIFLMSFSNASQIVFYNKTQPDFTSVYNMTFTNWQFCVNATKEGLCLQPAVTVSNTKYKINATTPGSVLTSFSQSILDKKTAYKFSFNVSVPTAARSNVNSFTLDIVGNTSAINSDNIEHIIYTGSYYIDFKDLISSGFSVTLNETSVTIGNITGKAFNFDPTVQLINAAPNPISIIPMGGTSGNLSIVAYCRSGIDYFTVYNTSLTQIKGETRFGGNADGNCIYQNLDCAPFNATAAVCGLSYDSGGSAGSLINASILNVDGTVSSKINIAAAGTLYPSRQLAVTTLDFHTFGIIFNWAATNQTLGVYDSNGTQICLSNISTTTTYSSNGISAWSSTSMLVTYEDSTPNLIAANYDKTCTNTTPKNTIIASILYGRSEQTRVINSTNASIILYDYNDGGDYLVMLTNTAKVGLAKILVVAVPLNRYTTALAVYNDSNLTVGSWNDTGGWSNYSLKGYTLGGGASTGILNLETLSNLGKAQNSQYIALGSYEYAVGQGFCQPEGTLYTYTNTTTQTILGAIYANGTAWDGSCPTLPPTYSSNSTNSTLAGTNIQHDLRWANGTAGANLSGYIFSFCNGTYSQTITTTTDWLSPTANTNLSVVGWTTPNNAMTWGEGSASTAITPELVNQTAFYTFNPNIPAGATILGIQVKTNMTTVSSITGRSNIRIRLSNNSGTSYLGNEYYITPTAAAGTYANYTNGSTSDLWGMTWTVTNANAIYVNMTGNASRTTRYPSVDWIGIAITYSIPTLFTCDNASAVMTDDSWTAFTGAMCGTSYTDCWSNVTELVNSTVGSTIKWCVKANDTLTNWNTTSCNTPFSYTTTSAGGTTCGLSLGSAISYGSLTAGTASTQDANYITVTNTGSTASNVQINGTAWVHNSKSFAVSYTHYYNASGHNYASKTALSTTATVDYYSLGGSANYNSYLDVQAGANAQQAADTYYQNVTYTSSC